MEMIKVGNDCVGCETCFNCGRRNDYHYHACDDCGSTEQLYKHDGKELCQECLLKYFDEVDMDDLE